MLLQLDRKKNINVGSKRKQKKGKAKKIETKRQVKDKTKEEYSNFFMFKQYVFVFRFIFWLLDGK